MSVIGMDLGVCGVFVPGGYCEGRLIVDRESGGMLEAVCSACGQVAARPMVRLRNEPRPESEPEPEPEREQMAF